MGTVVEELPFLGWEVEELVCFWAAEVAFFEPFFDPADGMSLCFAGAGTAPLLFASSFFDRAAASL